MIYKERKHFVITLINIIYFSLRIHRKEPWILHDLILDYIYHVLNIKNSKIRRIANMFSSLVHLTFSSIISSFSRDFNKHALEFLLLKINTCFMKKIFKEFSILNQVLISIMAHQCEHK